ncbi:MAG TPA: copper chaperone PCu(A)C [Luteimonas sp.]|nr:copper chaperone PCu(A)C [Luteimonas sp.]
MNSRSLLAGLLLASAVMPAPAQVPAPSASRACLPAVEAGWVRLPPMSMPMLAGFATVRNDCPAPVTVVSVSSPAFGAVELHESTVVGGVSRMRAVPRLRIEAGETVVLEPGGLHLMLMQPVSMPKAGDRIEMVLTLDDGRQVRSRWQARAGGPH